MELLLLLFFAISTLVTWVWCFVIGFRTNVVWGLLIVFFHPIATVVYSISYWYVVKKAFLYSMVAIVGLIWASFLYGSKTDEEPGNETVSAQVDGTKQTEIETARQAADVVMLQMEKMHAAGLISDEEMAQLRAEYETQLAAYDKRANQVGEAELDTDSPTPRTEVQDKQAKPETRALGTAADDSAATQAPLPRITSNLPESKVAKVISKDEVQNFIGREIILTDITGRERTGVLKEVRDRSLVVERRQRTGSMIFLISISDINSIKVK